MLIVCYSKTLPILFKTGKLLDVIEMKENRWAMPGVDYGQVGIGNLSLIPSVDRIAAVARDHLEAIEGGMFF